MVDMSRAIREVIEGHSQDATLKGLSDEDLEEIVSILSAFTLDLREEWDRRKRE